MTRPELSAENILEVFNRHNVEYLVIGAFAAIAQGAAIEATHDIDLTPRRDDDNLRRLSGALHDLGARIRVDALEEGLPFAHDAASLSRMDMLNLTCTAGDFDLVFAPAGSARGYEDLVPSAVTIRVGSQDARAASVRDVVRSKEEAGREKDIRALPALRQFVRDQEPTPLQRAVSLSFAWFPRAEWAKAITRWPDLLDELPADHLDYSRCIEARVKRVARNLPRQPMSVASMTVEGLVGYCEAHDLDAGDGHGRSAYAAELDRLGQARRWPPNRNDPCWCGSGRKYKECCGPVPRATDDDGDPER